MEPVGEVFNEEDEEEIGDEIEPKLTTLVPMIGLEFSKCFGEYSFLATAGVDVGEDFNLRLLLVPFDTTSVGVAVNSRGDVCIMK